VAVLDHVEVGNGSAGLAHQALVQLVVFQALALVLARDLRGVERRVLRAVVGKDGIGVCGGHASGWRLRSASMPTALQSEKARGLLMRSLTRCTSGNSVRIWSMTRSTMVSSRLTCARVHSLTMALRSRR